MKTLYFVPIDRTSIKLNNNHGSTSTLVVGNKTIKFSCKTLPNDFIDGINCYIYTYQLDNVTGNIYNIEGEIINEEFYDKCIQEKRENVEFIVNQNHQRINHLPISKYSFCYENIEIKCSECGENFMSNELIDNIDEDYISNICPICGEYDCCSILYEKIETVVD